MTPEERLAGFKRLGLMAAGLVGAALVIALVLAGLGSTRDQALAAGSGVVGIALVMGGVVAFGRTSAIRRTAGVYGRATVEERKDAERLALGLFASGILFSVCSLALG